MLRSMTGFGQSQGQKEGFHVNVEIRSLNSKFLDANMKLPKQLQEKELEIRNMLSTELVRGKVSLMIETSNQEVTEDKQVVNKALFKAYYKEFEGLAEEVNAGKDDLFRLALHSPDVLVGSEKDSEVLEKQVGENAANERDQDDQAKPAFKRGEHLVERLKIQHFFSSSLRPPPCPKRASNWAVRQGQATI